MSKDNRSFFEKLTGAVRINDDYEEMEAEAPRKVSPASRMHSSVPGGHDWLSEQSEEEGELSVDVYQNPNEIVIKTMVAGVRPDDLDVSITRDMVTVKGKREVEK